MKHLLWALVGDYGLEALQQRVTRKLSGLKCAAFYGCYLLRAQDHLPYDDPFNPRSMENVFLTVEQRQSTSGAELAAVVGLSPATPQNSPLKWRVPIWKRRSPQVQTVW